VHTGEGAGFPRFLLTHLMDEPLMTLVRCQGQPWSDVKASAPFIVSLSLVMTSFIFPLDFRVD